MGITRVIILDENIRMHGFRTRFECKTSVMTITTENFLEHVSLCVSIDVVYVDSIFENGAMTHKTNINY